MTRTERPTMSIFLARYAVVAVGLLLAAPMSPALSQDEAPARRTRPGAAAEEPVVELPVAVQAVLATNPTTPAELARAARIVADLDQPELARGLLKRIVDAPPDRDALAGMAAQFGSPMFIDFARRPALQPEGAQVSKLVLEAWNERLGSPERIRETIGRLQDPSEARRNQALRDLLEARGAAAGPLIDVLADANRAAEHPRVRGVLVALRSDAIDPLIGVLENSEPALMVQAIRVLAELNARQAILFLVGPYTSEKADPAVREAAGDALRRLVGRVPGRPEAVGMLVSRAKEYFQGKQPLEDEVAGEAVVWTWDTAARQAVSRTVPADDARRTMAARLMRDALALAPDDPQVKRLYLATMLEEAAYLNGLDKPLAEDDAAARRAAGFGVAALEDVLSYSMANGHAVAATAAARLLGQLGTADDLLGEAAQPRPLALALASPHRRVRFAAVEAIVRLKPAGPFAGSSQVLPVLTFFANTTGHPRALLAGPITADLRAVVDVLAAKGMQADVVVLGRDMTIRAAESPDYHLAYLDAQIRQPAAEFVLQQLRREPRSADLPVALMARDGFFDKAEKLARDDALTAAFPQPTRDEAVEWQRAELARLAGREAVGHEERQHQAGAALEMLAQLADLPEKLYPLRRAEDAALTALLVPDLATRAAAVLGKMGTPAAQVALVDLASRETPPIELRQAAAKHFAASVTAHGILLTTVEIRRQYDRYNQSATAATETQQVLAALLNAIEAPSEGLKRKAAAAEQPPQPVEE